MEPCNYASNIAYYHAALRVCEYPKKWSLDNQTVRAIKRGLINLAPGSAFMHGSHTNLGHAYDITAMSVVAYTAYYKAAVKFGATSNILLYLSDE